MTSGQRERIARLEAELGLPAGSLPINGESEGYIFTEVDGVTVLVAQKRRNTRGGYKVASVRTYDEKLNPSNLDAAINAKAIFGRQPLDPGRDYGHVGPIVDLRWKCGNKSCRCGREPYKRRVARSVGYDISVQGSD